MDDLNDFLGLAQKIAHYKTLVTSMEADMRNNLPKYMRKLRKSQNRMTQAELAEILNVDDSTISKIESGSLRAGDDLIMRMAQYVSTLEDEHEEEGLFWSPEPDGQRREE